MASGLDRDLLQAQRLRPEVIASDICWRHGAEVEALNNLPKRQDRLSVSVSRHLVVRKDRSSRRIHLALGNN